MISQADNLKLTTKQQVLSLLESLIDGESLLLSHRIGALGAGHRAGVVHYGQELSLSIMFVLLHYCTTYSVVAAISNYKEGLIKVRQPKYRRLTEFPLKAMERTGTSVIPIAGHTLARL